MGKCSKGACEVEDKSIITELKAGEHKYSFPKLGIVVVAKSLEEAEKKVKAMTEYETKSL